MNKPYISVVIPVYNESENLEQLYQRLIASLDKLGKPYEVILVTMVVKMTPMNDLMNYKEDDQSKFGLFILMVILVNIWR